MGKLYQLYKKCSHMAFVSTCAYFASDRIQPLWDKNRRYVCKKVKSKADNSVSKEKKAMCEVKIAYICDEMTYQSFAGLTQSVYLTPWNWYEVMEREKPDIFFCESAWSGIKEYEGCWRGRIYKNNKVKYNNRKVLFAILDYCRAKQIKTVFWNKEDPTFFGNQQNDFIDTALKFDYIFTTCEECVEKYQKLGHARVMTLPFGLSPKIYNPMGSAEKENTAIFAGSWYPDMQERCAQMEEMFAQVLENGIRLEIYDRNYNNTKTVNHFPEKYQKYVSGFVPFEEMGRKVKHARYAVNINSVTDSKTMFARRVFEMMASNVCIISNESVGMREMFGGRVWFAGEKFDTAHLKEICRENVQEVLENHTNAVRMKKLLTELALLKETEKTKVAVVTTREITQETVQECTQECEGLEISYCASLEGIPKTADYFVVEKEKAFGEKEIRQMLVHYQYLEHTIGVYFGEERYRVTESDEWTDTLFHIGNLAAVKECKTVVRYGI